MVSNRQESPNLENQFQLLARHVYIKLSSVWNLIYTNSWIKTSFCIASETCSSLKQGENKKMVQKLTVNASGPDFRAV